MSRRARLARRTAGGCALVLLLAVGWAWWGSRLPSSYSAAAMGVPDFGGGPGSGEPGHHHGAPVAAPDAVSVVDLAADPDAPADAVFDLVAAQTSVTLPDGATFDGFTLDGVTPGPALHVRQGDLVEVRFTNADIAGGATLHWHGVDVPNAADGVAGVTQDAVRPGQAHTYRFVADDAGTYWYHSHQVAHAQVVGGLFGTLVVEPAGDPPAGHPAATTDAVVALHSYPGGVRTLNGRTGVLRVPAAPGEVVRVRLVNTDNTTHPVWVPGSPFALLAVDGRDVLGPPPVTDVKVSIPAGGRADLAVAVPTAGAVRVQTLGGSVLVGPVDADAAPAASAPPRTLDPLTYGTPAPLPFDPNHADRRFTYDIGRAPGFLDGVPGWWWTINGRIVPHVPMWMVAEGDVVVTRITNTSGEVHPMHLHGHHAVVLSRNGVAASGSPWWVDSLDVAHGETYEIAFVADNPGLWMDHCHNLPHAEQGLMTHLMYAGVTTPFLLGHATGNDPE